MPEETDQEQRETYGDAPGWSGAMTTNVPDKGAPAGASPTPGADTAPLAEVVEEQPPSSEQVTEQAPPTPSQPATEDVPIERQKELEEARRQKNESDRQRDEAMRLVQEALQRPVQPVQPPQPQADPWEPYVKHQDPQTAQFWQSMHTLVQHERRQARQEAVQDLQPMIQAGMEKLAVMDLRDFRKENPEITAGSKEEAQIVAYMEGRMDGMRHPLESAKRNVLFDKLNTEVKAYKTKQAAIPQKRAAATSEASAGIPAGAGLPGQKRGAMDRASEVADKGGGVLDMAKAFFK